AGPSGRGACPGRRPRSSVSGPRGGARSTRGACLMGGGGAPRERHGRRRPRSSSPARTPPTARSGGAGGEVMTNSVQKATAPPAKPLYWGFAQSPFGSIPQPLTRGAEMHWPLGFMLQPLSAQIAAGAAPQWPSGSRPQPFSAQIGPGAVPQRPFGSMAQPLSAQIELNFPSRRSSQPAAFQGSARAATGAARATNNTATAKARRERDMSSSQFRSGTAAGRHGRGDRPSSKYGAPPGGKYPPSRLRRVAA